MRSRRHRRDLGMLRNGTGVKSKDVSSPHSRESPVSIFITIAAILELVELNSNAFLCRLLRTRKLQLYRGVSNTVSLPPPCVTTRPQMPAAESGSRITETPSRPSQQVFGRLKSGVLAYIRYMCPRRSHKRVAALMCVPVVSFTRPLLVWHRRVLRSCHLVPARKTRNSRDERTHTAHKARAGTR